MQDLVLVWAACLMGGFVLTSLATVVCAPLLIATAPECKALAFGTRAIVFLLLAVPAAAVACLLPGMTFLPALLAATLGLAPFVGLLVSEAWHQTAPARRMAKRRRHAAGPGRA